MPTTSIVRSLNSLLDDQGVLRVRGGRLAFAGLKYEQRHLIILPKSAHLTKLIVRKEHERMLHAGFQAVLSTVRRKYWPLSTRSVIKGITQQCMRCNRVSPRGTSYLMGQLVPARVSVQSPFLSAGVDYAGPLYVKEKTRSKTGLAVTKAYLCLFVCMATKAVHLELAAHFTTEAFLKRLQRFVARRGICREIHSDNGTNFVGARNEIQRIKMFLKSNQKTISERAVAEGFDWHLIPPHAPHFGGLWERFIRSAKQHLLRVIGETRLTFDELYTVLTQVEACMNSTTSHVIRSCQSQLPHSWALPNRAPTHLSSPSRRHRRHN